MSVDKLYVCWLLVTKPSFARLFDLTTVDRASGFVKAST